MKLITGGAWQGQEAFAEELYKKNDRQQKHGMNCWMADGLDASLDEMKQADIVTHLHLWIQRVIHEQCQNTEKKEELPEDEKIQKEIWHKLEKILEENPQIILTVQELGCGIVPVDAFDRKWREITGRVCCQLAAQAEEVYRMTCGIGTKIK